MGLMCLGGVEDSQLVIVVVLRPLALHPSFLQICAQLPPFFLIVGLASVSSLSACFLLHLESG